MGVTWASSADKHGVSHDDAINAILNAVYSESGFDASRIPGGISPTLFIGPSKVVGGPMLEVMVEVKPPDTFHIFHVMPARRKHLDRMGGDEHGNR